MESISKYNILKFLDNGFFGRVFLCEDPYLEEKYAVKVIRIPSPEKYVEAINEGQTLNICKHKHIVAVKEVNETHFQGEHVIYIVMEYLEKGSIQKLLRGKFISVKLACKIIQEALLGLEHAHNNGILHRDIKPGNILITDCYDYKLSDFGLAINYKSNFVDTFGYKPHKPLEVWEGNPMSRLSDIYAMGITFYRLLNNLQDIPFDFCTQDEVINSLRKNLYPERIFAKHIPTKIINIINCSIHSNKNKRYQNCTDFRQALNKLKFNIDWIKVNENYYTGECSNNKFSIERYSKSSGWVIDYKKNGIRKTELCFKNLKDKDVENIFFRIIQSTTIVK